MKYSISITFFISLLFTQYPIEGRWHLVGYENNIMYQFVDTEPFADAGNRYAIYSLDGNFGGLEDAGGSPNPYIVKDDIITIDLFFGNVVNYQINFRCNGQVVEFIYIPNEIIHSTLFREGYNYINNTCEEYGDINNDGQINVIDVILLVSYILDGLMADNGDINEDGFLNVIDIVMLVDIILD